jgi:hypothetical protein
MASSIAHTIRLVNAPPAEAGGAFTPASANITQFVNADLIASGLSPFAPEREAIQAGRLMLRQIDKLVA